MVGLSARLPARHVPCLRVLRAVLRNRSGFALLADLVGPPADATLTTLRFRENCTVHRRLQLRWERLAFWDAELLPQVGFVGTSPLLLGKIAPDTEILVLRRRPRDIGLGQR